MLRNRAKDSYKVAMLPEFDNTKTHHMQQQHIHATSQGLALVCHSQSLS
jgi:hypothetical protein